MDSLLSIVQMPAGVPVGTLAIGKAGAINAALLAAAMLATATRRSRARLEAWREKQTGIGRRSPRMIVPPGSTIGIIGGGQFGRMLAHGGGRSSATAATSSPRTSAVRRPTVAAAHTRAASTTPTRSASSPTRSMSSTYEFENLPVAPLAALGDKLRPGARSLAIAQDRARREGLHRQLRRARGAVADGRQPGRCRRRRSPSSACRSCSRPAATAMTARARRGSARPTTARRLGRDRRAAGGRRGGGRLLAEFSVILARWTDGRRRASGTARERARRAASFAARPCPRGDPIAAQVAEASRRPRCASPRRSAMSACSPSNSSPAPTGPSSTRSRRASTTAATGRSRAR